MKTSPGSGVLPFFSAVFCALALILSNPATGGPGAHGPGGEHLDQPSASAGTVAALPRFETATELFELVAVLTGGELSILIDRFETNAPVLEAVVEVESGGKKAVARFHADHGDYAVDDPAFLAVVAQPGEHAIVVSVTAKGESDLLDGTLVVADAPGRNAAAGHAPGGHGHDHDHTLERVLIGGAGVVLVTLIILLWRRKRRQLQRPIGTSQQVQS